MFSKAYVLASKFTFPVIVSSRFFDGTVESGLATFVLINEQGWVLTAAHVVEPLNKIKQDRIEIENYQQQVASINQDVSLNIKRKREKIGRLVKNDKWITNVSHWWGANGLIISSFVGSPFGDFALGKIENYTPDKTQVYPKFRQTKEDLLGSSVCKLGFPLHHIKSQWDIDKKLFILEENSLPVPRFPIDGICARFQVTKFPDNSELKFIETTTPGLKGQSGGPIFDTDGNICAIQVRTIHYELGFNTQSTENNKKQIVPQFLNTGIGISSESIINFLQKQKITVSIV